MKNQIFRNNRAAFGAAFAGLALAVSTASAQFSVDTLTADGSNIDTSGVISTEWAWSLDNGSGTQTVNGIVFSEAAPTDASLSGFQGGVNTGAGGNYTGDMANVMDEFRVSGGSGVGGFLRVTLNNLTVGETYRLQMLHDTTNTGTRESQVNFIGDNAFGGTIIESSSVFTTTDADLGKLSKYEWTPSATTQRFEIEAVAGRSQFNGAVLQQIPEPGAAAALFGIGALAAVALRRRQ